MPLGETIVALATPSGEAAIAAIRVSGPSSHHLVTQCLRGRSSPTPRRMTIAKYRDRAGDVIDDVMYAFFAAGASYTGEATLEIFPHGNPFIVQRIIEDLMARGCRAAEPGEFTRTAFLNGKMDLSQAEAVAEVIRARSDFALSAARQRLSGELGIRVNTLMNKHLAVLAGLEAYIDFPEEDLPPETEDGPAAELRMLERELGKLRHTSHYTAMLEEGVRAVILGPPNAGKSSLLNALVGGERVIVSDEPGTTRDFIEASVVIGPYLLRLVDTAGVGPVDSEIDRRGIEKTYEQMEAADLLLIVVDSTLPCPDLPERIGGALHGTASILVENKEDLPACRERESEIATEFRCGVSALRGTGIAELKELMVSALKSDVFDNQADGLFVSVRHGDALARAKSAVEGALDKLRHEVPTELVVSDLRAAVDAMGEIVGRVDNEAMLDRLFDEFCIGK